MKEPTWLRTDVVLAIHDRLLAEHGGATGLGDQAVLESALARPRNLFVYEKRSMFELAAAYVCGIIKNHPFVDANKRTGFMAAFTFLALNRIELVATEEHVVLRTLAVAANEITEEDYAGWLKENSRTKKKDRH